ncbi:MAG TPA: AarF/UbiB family protein, partial [Acidimicrobiales bacterium]|nr:AarF/UbiB family protein [Acidimicrobiales bacterium]
MTTTLQAPDAYDAARIDGVRPADVARLAEVATALARNGLVTVGRRGGGVALQPRQQAPRALAVALRRSFADLGPTYIKFGQLIASSPGLFPEFLSSEFRRLLDSVPPEPVGRVRAVIEREFGRPLAAIFADFDDHPLAAASVAQVHRGVLHDGTEVAVKVRRPRLRARIEQDLRLLRLLAGVLARAGALGETLNPTAVVEDLAATIRAELDFRAEAESMVAFAANLESSGTDHGCVVPRPIDGLVTERVLVMTFVEGVPVDDGSALRAAGHDLEGLVRTGVRAWLEGALAHGLFHGDVHAGNLFVTPAGQIAFLDFGIMGRLDNRTRLVLRRALPALLIDGDFRSVVRAVFDLGATTGPVDVEAATADVRELLEPLAAKPMGEISYGELLGHVLSVATRYHVVLPRELVLVVKQLVYFERYAKELAPRYRILADPTILGHLVDNRAQTAEPPPVRARADTRELDGPGGGLAVPRVGEVRFSWDYTRSQRDLTKLYEKAKRSQWNTATDIDWSIDVDPLDTGGMASYLPMVAAESFERFSDAERAEAARQFNAWI